MTVHSHSRIGAYLALLAAGLFGMSTPVAKALLAETNPALLAGLLYLGAGLGMSLLRILNGQSRKSANREAPITNRDLPWLAGAVIAGGVVGPVLLMMGLTKTSAANTSLLLNSEAVLTALLAWTIFKENFDRRIFIGMIAIVSGAVLLSWAGRPQGSSGVGELLIAAACLAWALDNNFTRMISGKDPQWIAAAKGLVAGTINTAMALTSGASFPPLETTISAILVGFAGYGLSIQLYVIALRHIGAARTGAYFSVAPFAGAALSILMFRTPLTPAFIAAAVLMAAGVWLHLTERHNHDHVHETLSHAHRHVHDEHHQHEHPHDDSAHEPHSHSHLHSPLFHTHRHYPDSHHRHNH